MKIAIMGSAPSSVQLAPFKNSDYHAWTQGRIDSLTRAYRSVPGDFDIWGCSPACWASIPRATRWFEVHRWEPGKAWFSHEYCQFLIDFKGPVYTGGKIEEIPNHVVYPIDRIEEKFSSYFLTSSIALMLALAIDEIETKGVTDDDVIGLWGVDMSAFEEWGYQRPGCQFFVLEALRRGIGVYLPEESDLMRPMPVYGISEWDHNYIKLTSRARDLSERANQAQMQMKQAEEQLNGLRGESAALNAFVNTWTSPYGFQHGIINRHTKGTGLGSGITHLDTRPVTRMTIEDDRAKEILDAMTKPEKGNSGEVSYEDVIDRAGG